MAPVCVAVATILASRGCASTPRGVLLPVQETVPGASQISMLVATPRLRDPDPKEYFSGEDETLKNLYARYASQYQQIAAYRSLIAIAKAAGETAHTVGIQQSIHEEEPGHSDGGWRHRVVDQPLCRVDDESTSPPLHREFGIK